YFRKAHELMNAMIARPATYFVFSDDYEYATASFDFVPDRVIVPGDVYRPCEDVVLMSRCRHHIIANSSFSWWGALLNAAPDKQVIAPRAWFHQSGAGQLNPVDLYPAGSILI